MKVQHAKNKHEIYIYYVPTKKEELKSLNKKTSRYRSKWRQVPNLDNALINLKFLRYNYI